MKGDVIMSENSLKIRNSFKEYDDKRDAGLTTPPEIARFDDICYGTDPKWQSLDVYRPKAAEGKLPVIVSFHGGAWVYGDKERYQYYCMELAKHGFTVVNFTYRLAPEFQYPAPLEDANLVFAWVMEHAEEYGFDTEKIFGVGDSAGATGIAMYTCILTNPNFAKCFDFKVPRELKLRGVGLACGLYSLHTKLDSMEDFVPAERMGSAMEELNVIEHVTPDFPPAFIFSSNGDFLREEPGYLLPVLDRCGVAYTYRFLGDDANTLWHVFHLDIRSEAAISINTEMCDFFHSL